jgi:hypothetical protein
MNKWWILVLALFIIMVMGVVLLVVVPSPAKAPSNTASGTPVTTNDLSDTIVVDSPMQGGAVASPMTITGKARGTYYFEASFPVTLVDASGKVMARGHAQAQSDWMTTDFVPFTAALTFVQPGPGTHGTLKLMNDNPSGDPAKQKELDIPVMF